MVQRASHCTGVTAAKHFAIWLPPRVRSWFYVQQLLGYAFAILAGSANVRISWS